MTNKEEQAERDKKGLEVLRVLKAEWDQKEVSDKIREDVYYTQLKERIAKLELIRLT